MADNRMIKLCGLYENTSKTTGKRYFVGNLSFSSKLLLLQNDQAEEGEPTWTLFLCEREQKQDSQRPAASGGDRRRYPEAGDHGGIDGGDYPTRLGEYNPE